MNEEIKGIFNGQVFISDEGKIYPVPANYASKSRLVEGDILKLEIDLHVKNPIRYKQIGLTPRENVIGTFISRGKREIDNIVRLEDGTEKRVLNSAKTYYGLESGDSVLAIIPSNKESTWCAIECILN